MLELANALTCFWLFSWAILAVRRLLQGQRDSIYFLILVHVLFCGLPVLLDLTLGLPDYRIQPGFYLSSRDPTVRWIYCGYVSLVPPLWYAFGRAKRKGTEPEAIAPPPRLNSRMARLLQPVLYLTLILPVAAVLTAPDPAGYWEYANHIFGRLGPEVHEHHILVNLAAILCVIGACGIIFMAEPLRVSTVLGVLPFVFFAYWVHGKRNIVAISLLLFLSTLWLKRLLQGLRLILAGALAAMAMVVFSLAYQQSVRGIDLSDDSQVYDNFRVDYGRDGVIKMAIYAELYPERLQILEYRGQSLLFYPFMYLPRSIWPDKPWPYGVYVTSAMLLMKRPTPLGWTMTTSWLEEMIANLGWAGILVGPLSLALFCRIGDRSGYEFGQGLTVIIGCLLLVQNFVAYIPLLVLWGVLLITTGRRRRPALSAPPPPGYPARPRLAVPSECERP